MWVVKSVLVCVCLSGTHTYTHTHTKAHTHMRTETWVMLVQNFLYYQPELPSSNEKYVSWNSKREHQLIFIKQISEMKAMIFYCYHRDNFCGTVTIDSFIDFSQYGGVMTTSPPLPSRCCCATKHILSSVKKRERKKPKTETERERMP